MKAYAAKIEYGHKNDSPCAFLMYISEIEIAEVKEKFVFAKTNSGRMVVLTYEDYCFYTENYRSLRDLDSAITCDVKEIVNLDLYKHPTFKNKTRLK